MIEAIQRYFQQRLDPQEAPTTGADRLQIATCALLLEVAHADEEFTDDERALVIGHLRTTFGLERAVAEQLIELAEAERSESHDLYQFARLINEHYSREEKLQVMDRLWRVVYSDGRLEQHEDAVMHKLANLFQLRHEELIALKLRVKRGLDTDGAPDSGGSGA